MSWIKAPRERASKISLRTYMAIKKAAFSMCRLFFLSARRSGAEKKYSFPVSEHMHSHQVLFIRQKIERIQGDFVIPDLKMEVVAG
jgi:hypothetical protein